MTRTALPGYPLGDYEKDYLVQLIQQYSRLFFTEIYGFVIMGSHFHLLCCMYPGSDYSDADIKERYIRFYGDDAEFEEENIDQYRKKWSSLSWFIKEIKQSFSVFYNRRHKRRGTFWGERFKSTLVESGDTLINCLAYIDLNPIRAGLVERPEDYRWCSLGYHVQTKNYNEFLSLDFGLVEFGELDADERFRRYREYVYETGAVQHPSKPSSSVIDEKIVDKERKRKYKFSRVDRFRSRTRYFSESGIIGTKEFVSKNYQRFKECFSTTKKEKIPKHITGLTGIYSLKRLTEQQ